MKKKKAQGKSSIKNEKENLKIKKFLKKGKL